MWSPKPQLSVVRALLMLAVPCRVPAAWGLAEERGYLTVMDKDKSTVGFMFRTQL